MFLSFFFFYFALGEKADDDSVGFALLVIYIVMKTAIKTILWVVLVPVALVLLLAVLIYLPPVQQWAAESVASYVSRTTGMTARVGKVRLRL